MITIVNNELMAKQLMPTKPQVPSIEEQRQKRLQEALPQIPSIPRIKFDPVIEYITVGFNK